MKLDINKKSKFVDQNGVEVVPVPISELASIFLKMQHFIGLGSRLRPEFEEERNESLLRIKKYLNAKGIEFEEWT